MPSQVVTYAVDDDEATFVSFEIEPVEGFRPASAESIAGQVRQAIGPAVAAARQVLDRVRELAPDGVEVKFGVKVTGTANWLVAKAATEGNFEVTLSWSPQRP
ncbi:CU044_2847 family protein [Micromonospora vulcania]|uniref:CU044_2847 family protein n=1 Tax=Micromonospora vulcania TaxID=1441873 RepID=A0ABW1H729_9ACTN